MLFLPLLALVACGGAAGASETIHVVLDASSGAVRFDGIGAVSGGGGGTRLLFDYPATQRNSILDLLFKPSFGASLHTLKVEIGCDGDTTQGSEQTHWRTPEETPSASTLDRGYETWLMKEAKKRNADIKLSGLEWGVPGWVANASTGSIFTSDNQRYIIAWLKGLNETHGLAVDSVGLGFNERGYDNDWIVDTRAKMNKAGLSAVKVIAADLCCGSQFAPAVDMAMAGMEDFKNAVDVIGTHCPGSLNGQASPSAAMLKLGKPFWNTEQHFGEPDGSPDGCGDWSTFVGVAREINQNWAIAKHSSVLFWTPVFSWYGWLPYRGKGLFTANEPWSGFFNTTAMPLWAVAHTTQFTAPGWRFLGGAFNCSTDIGPLSPSINGTAACGVIHGEKSPSGRADPWGSFVAYVAPDGKDFTLVIESFGAPEAIDFSITLVVPAGEGEGKGEGLLDGEVGEVGDVGEVGEAGAAENAQVTFQRWTSSQAGGIFIKETPVTAMVVAGGGASVGGAEVAAETAAASGGQREVTLQVSVSVPRDSLWTLTTLTSGQKGKDGTVPASAPFPLPFVADFEALGEDKLPRFISDMSGAFTGHTHAADSRKVLKQWTVAPPVATHGGNQKQYFSAAVGGPTWRGYNATIDAMSLALPSPSVEAKNGEGTACSSKRPGSRPGSGGVLFLGSHAGMVDVTPESLFDNFVTPGFTLFLHMPAPAVSSPPPRCAGHLGELGAKSANWTLMHSGGVVATGSSGTWRTGQWSTISLSVSFSGSTSSTSSTSSATSTRSSATTTAATTSLAVSSKSAVHVTAIVDGVVLFAKQLAVDIDPASIGGPVFFGTGHHQGLFDNLSVR